MVLEEALERFDEDCGRRTHQKYKLVDVISRKELQLNQSIGEQVGDGQILMAQLISIKEKNSSVVDSSSRQKRNLVSSPRAHNNKVSMLNRNPTALEAIMVLQDCTLQDICVQCGVDRYQAEHLLTTVSNVVKQFGTTSASNKHEAQRLEPQILQFYQDSPMFRRQLAAAEFEVRSEETRLSIISDAASNFCTAGERFCNATAEFARTLRPLDMDDAKADADYHRITESTEMQLKPLRESVLVYLDRQTELLSCFESYLVEPLKEFVRCDLQNETKRLKVELNRAFSENHKAMLAAVMDHNKEVKFQIARLNVVENLNGVINKEAIYLNTCVRKCLNAMEACSRPWNIDIPIATVIKGISFNDQRDRIIRSDSLSSLESAIPRIPNTSICCQSYVFRLTAANESDYERERKWLFIDDRGYLCTLMSDRRTTEIIADLASCYLDICKNIRYGFKVHSNKKQLRVCEIIFQADTEQSYHKWLHYISMAISEGPHEKLRDLSECDTKQAVVYPHSIHKCSENDFKQIAQCTLPISTLQYFDLFLSDKSKFLDRLYSKRGCSEVTLSNWRSNGSNCGYRTQSFRIPVDSSLISGSTRVNAVEQYRLNHDATNLILLSQVVSLDVPYGTYFTAETKIKVLQSPTHPNHCEFRAFIGVHFAKETMFRHMIESSCVEETSESTGLMIELIMQDLGSPILSPASAGTI